MANQRGVREQEGSDMAVNARGICDPGFCIGGRASAFGGGLFDSIFQVVFSRRWRKRYVDKESGR